MTCSVIDTLRGLLVIAMMLGIPAQTLWAQGTATESSSDSAAARAPATSGSDWTGLYIGAHTGVSSGHSAWSETLPGAPNISGSLDVFRPFNVFDGSGSQFGGLVAGYNHRLRSRVVIGVEADLSFAAEPVVAAATYHEAPELFGTVRARVGYDAKRRLYYATGGLAWTHDQFTRTASYAGSAGSPSGGAVDVTFAGRIGWTVGGGIEAPVAPGWTGS
jgi:high affinity Mn2+ porin